MMKGGRLLHNLEVDSKQQSRTRVDSFETPGSTPQSDVTLTQGGDEENMSLEMEQSQNVVSGTRNNKMTGKKVKLLDLENEQVAEDIVMSIDLKKIVMGRPIRHMLVDEAK
ncbi:hypothetical protein Taro_003170 [Colocasia esculenta]|uniref:Uncharacterized protein n=1 Tax=Colocasia esculenta TaxID=4460 RepID=A0A843TMX8_COLES|nr:hypothetical protein [Colocasia esculenta]